MQPLKKHDAKAKALLHWHADSVRKQFAKQNFRTKDEFTTTHKTHRPSKEDPTKMELINRPHAIIRHVGTPRDTNHAGRENIPFPPRETSIPVKASHAGYAREYAAGRFGKNKRPMIYGVKPPNLKKRKHEGPPGSGRQGVKRVKR